MAIFHNVLAGRVPSNMGLGRVHRAMGPKSLDAQRLWDIICGLHRLTHQETVLWKAWEAGIIEVDGTSVKVLPDLRRATIQRGALLCPVLDRARQEGCTYRWRYPLAVTIRKGLSYIHTLLTKRPPRPLFLFKSGAFCGSELAATIITDKKSQGSEGLTVKCSYGPIGDRDWNGKRTFFFLNSHRGLEEHLNVVDLRIYKSSPSYNYYIFFFFFSSPPLFFLICLFSFVSCLGDY